MDARGTTLTAAYIFFGIIAGFVISYFAVRYHPRERYLAAAEYWIFLPGVQMPEQTAVMARTIGDNPYDKRNRLPIGTREGQLFSDVRLHIALVLRQKNPHAFRPDLFDATTEVPPHALEILEEANSFVKVRYASEDRLDDNKHLQFLPHVADAIAELGDGKLIYDSTTERLILRSELQEELREHYDVSGADLHSRVVWRPEPAGGGHAETRGLVKVGHHELRTPVAELDQRVVISAVLQRVMELLWTTPKLPDTLEVEMFESKFRVLFEGTRDKFTLVRILREISA